MEYKIKLFLSFLIIRSIFGEEVRQLSFLNGNCDGIPYATYANTLCYPDTFAIVNESTIKLRNSNGLQDCKVDTTNYNEQQQSGDIHNLYQCTVLSDSYENSISENYDTIIDKKTIINNDDDSSSTSSSYEIPSFSYLFTYTKSRLPLMVNGYCNQIKLYNCENYQIYSFKNDSCFSNTDSFSSYSYYKQMCRGDSILTFKCEECSSNSLETCILDNTEPSNLSECPNIKYTTIEKLLKEIKNNNK